MIEEKRNQSQPITTSGTEAEARGRKQRAKWGKGVTRGGNQKQRTQAGRRQRDNCT